MRQFISSVFSLERKRKLYLGMVYMLVVFIETAMSIHYGLGPAGIMAVASQAVSLAGGLGVLTWGYAKEQEHIASTEVARCQNGNGNGGPLPPTNGGQ